MKRYDSYKDSGVKWLGEIPSHWEMRKMKFSFDERSDKGYPSLPLLAATQNHGVIKKEDYENRTVEATKSLDTLKKVEKGDFVISLRSFQGGIELCYCRGIISPAYTILRPTHIKGCYYKYLGKSPIFIQLLKSMVTGIREGQNIDYAKLRDNQLPIPSLKEQEAIANYLDSATSKIDEAIAQQQKMIDLLNERKQIIINNAVTKGLDPKAPLKDSGVNYLGLIPSSWDVKRVASLGKFAKGGNISRDNLQDEGKPAILYGDIYTKYNISAKEIKNHVSSKVASESVRIYNGDLLMTGSGETKEDIGKTIVFEGEEAYIGGDVILFRQSDNNSKFLSYALNSQYAKVFRYRESKGEIVVHIYANAVRRLYLAIPNLKEQNVLVDYLDKNIAIIDSEIDVIERQISLLQERKQIIINDVVTGKVKVV